MFRFLPGALTLTIGVILSLSATGCGSGNDGTAIPDDPDAASKEVGLNEIGELFRVAAQEGKTKPKSGDFDKYSMLSMVGFKKLQDGDIVVLWGAPVDPNNTTTVLAYDKETPASGGYVLMQDTFTVKHMTADEFKAAPKAATPEPAG